MNPERLNILFLSAGLPSALWRPGADGQLRGTMSDASKQRE